VKGTDITNGLLNGIGYKACHQQFDHLNCYSYASFDPIHSTSSEQLIVYTQVMHATSHVIHVILIFFNLLK